MTPVLADETRFEPLSVGAVIDRAFRLYAQNFVLMLGIAALFYVPLLALQLLVALSTVPSDNPIGAMTLVLVGALLAILNFVVVTPLVTGATTQAVSERYLGREVTIGAALSAAVGRFGDILLAQLVASLVIAGGLLLLIVPGILWMLSYALIAPVAMLEGLGSADIRRRSWDLVDGHRGRVFAVLLLVVVLQILLATSSGLVTLFGFEAGSRVAVVVDFVLGSGLSLALYPFQMIAITLLYYDIRIRKEGFDLEMLSQAIAAPGPIE